MCNGNEEHWDYLLKREAWIIQNRRRSEIAAAFRTEAEGSGKSFWCNQLGHLYGKHYMHLQKAEHVIERKVEYTFALRKKRLLCTEALYVSDHRHESHYRLGHPRNDGECL